MWRSWIVLLVVLGFFASPAAAAEFEGFGPIRFGMTKDEAWEAIKGQGAWVTPDVLNYDHRAELGMRQKNLGVKQEFRNGRAADAMIDYQTVSFGSGRCMADGIRFAGLIGHKYEIAPEIQYGVPGESTPGDEGSFMVKDRFKFLFENKGSIEIKSQYRFASDMCRVLITYFAADPE